MSNSEMWVPLTASDNVVGSVHAQLVREGQSLIIVVVFLGWFGSFQQSILLTIKNGRNVG